MSRAFSAACGLVLAFATAASAQAPEERIRQGVLVAGVDVGNLTVPEATAKLQQTLGPILVSDLTVAVAGQRFRLRTKSLGFVFDAERSAKRALYAGRNAGPAPPGGGGGTAPGIDVPPATEFRRMPIKAFTERIDRAVYVAPRNARARITLKRIMRSRAKAGRDLDAKALRASIEAALADPRLPRLLKPGRKELRAQINVNDLKRIYGTVITIDRSNFKLRLFKRLRLSKTYGIAVGAFGYDTPTGMYRIRNKSVNPAWTAPNKPWAGIYAGATVPGGSPQNPLKARWLGIANGVGIHGTGAPWSIGTRASHGCIRMRVPDVIDLYPRVPIGTPVLIK